MHPVVEQRVAGAPHEPMLVLQTGGVERLAQRRQPGPLERSVQVTQRIRPALDILLLVLLPLPA